MRRRVRSRNLKNEEAMARIGPQRPPPQIFENCTLLGYYTATFRDNLSVPSSSV